MDFKTIGTEIEEVVGEVVGDLKDIAKKHGAWIVFGLVVIYLWRKIK